MRVIQWIWWTWPNKQAIGSTVYSFFFFLRKSIMMGPFTSQNIVCITFTYSCAWNFFFTGESICFFFMSCFQYQDCHGKSMFSPFVKTFFTKIRFSIHTPHPSVNFTWVTLPSRQNPHNKPLFNQNLYV